jgi:hypothetical protein
MRIFVKCKKNLFKSTYNKLAFQSGRYYEIIKHDEKFLWIKDSEKRDFSFSKSSSEIYYWIEDYFE